MKFSLQVFNDNTPWSTFAAIAQTMDRGRWYGLWNYDHLVPPLAELAPHLTDDLARYEEGDVFEGWSMLAAWAAQTERLRLGCLVTAIPFRNPALLAKMAATVDHISNGRLELGIGAAWHTGETRAYGLELGTVKQRLDRFEEAVKVLALLLHDERPRQDFAGEYFKLDQAPFAPRPLQKRLPILIGGGGEKRTLRLVAEYADSYNFFANYLATPDTFLGKIRVLEEHCAAIGRDPREIRKTVAIFADIEDDDTRARQRREFLGKPLDEAGRNSILFGSSQRIVDGTAEILSRIDVDEVIFCGLTPTPEAIQRFDEEVIGALQPVAVH